MYKMLLFAKILGILPLLNIDIEQESKLVNMYRRIGRCIQVVISCIQNVYRLYPASWMGSCEAGGESFRMG